MLAEITRTYAGQEGRRIKAGTRFAVGVTIEGLKTISLPRFNQLKAQRLAKEVDGTALAAPSAKPAPTPRRGAERPPPNKMEPPSRARPTQPARSRSRKRTQSEQPEEPRPLDRPQAGGPDGEGTASSSSQEVRQTGSLTLRQRGTRRRTSAGSQSTTPASLTKPPAATTSKRGSRAGPKSSTPATPTGGDTSEESQSSEVLD